ncbi:MAG: hypothetical protein CL678_14305 [Bdellovibrionaceae bacterium]|nr:hypothetical protein [Pseudobdellovibrionaceae bacterium]|tara:strand:- start:57 stop:314 length:258 start_codon:yes stop_codon:yes gene_type:complete
MSAGTRQIEGEIKTHDALSLKSIVTLPAEPKAAALIISGGGVVGASGDVSSPFVGSGYKGAPPNINEQIADTLLEADLPGKNWSS